MTRPLSVLSSSFFLLFVCCVCSHSAIDSERYLASFAYVNQVYKGGVLNIKKGGKKIFIIQIFKAIVSYKRIHTLLLLPSFIGFFFTPSDLFLFVCVCVRLLLFVVTYTMMVFLFSHSAFFEGENISQRLKAQLLFSLLPLVDL